MRQMANCTAQLLIGERKNSFTACRVEMKIAQLGVNFYVSIAHFHAAFFLVRVLTFPCAADAFNKQYCFCYKNTCFHQITSASAATTTKLELSL